MGNRQVRPRDTRCDLRVGGKRADAAVLRMIGPIAVRSRDALQAANDPQFVKEHGATLATSDDWFVRYLIASSVYARPEVLNRLAFDCVPRVRAAARSNFRVPKHLHVDTELDEFFDASWEVKALENVRSEQWVKSRLRRVLNEFPNNVYVRLWIAGHPKAARSILSQLSTSWSPRVRLLVACNKATSPQVLKRLAQDPDRDVLLAVAGNPNTPPAALRSLAHALHPGVREAINHREPRFVPLFASTTPKRHAVGVVETPIETHNASTLNGPASVAIPVFDLLQAPPILRTIADRRGLTDALAIHAVLAYEAGRGYAATAMEHNNKGFDVLSRRGGRTVQIEVKGVGPEASTLHLSRAQIEFSKANPDHFELAIVITSEVRATELIVCTNPFATELPDALAAATLDVAALRAVGEVIKLRSSAQPYHEVFPLFDGDVCATGQ